MAKFTLCVKRTYNWTPLCFLIICFLVRIVFGVNVNRAFLLFCFSYGMFIK